MTGRAISDSDAPPYDLVIVGAGPAGMSAAVTAHGLGLRVAVVDEQQDAGGQILRQPPSAFRIEKNSANPSLPNAAALLAAFRGAVGIDRFYGETAWGVFPDETSSVLEIPTSSLAGGRRLRASSLLIATGAYDLPVAFPGWTLPGVMSAGGVQTLIKSQFLLPGRRFVLAGSHPLLLLVADLLLDAGADIAEVAIARPLPSLREMAKALPAVPGHTKLFLGFAGQMARLRHRGVPVRHSTIIRATHGRDQVSSVTLSRVDADWKVKPGTERRVEADTLVVGYGLLSSSELARQAGCAAEWRPERGGWVVSHDADMRSSVENIFVAGEPAGVAGATIAALEGELAALSVAARQGVLDAGRAGARRDVIRRRIASARTFADTVLNFFAPRLDRLAELTSDDTLACRCEEVSAGTVRRFLGENRHVTDINSVKLACRTGMGLCQGRYCQHTIAHITAQKRSMPVEEVGAFSAQAPVKPVTVRTLMKLAEGD